MYQEGRGRHIVKTNYYLENELARQSILIPNLFPERFSKSVRLKVPLLLVRQKYVAESSKTANLTLSIYITPRNYSRYILRSQIGPNPINIRRADSIQIRWKPKSSRKTYLHLCRIQGYKKGRDIHANAQIYKVLVPSPEVTDFRLLFDSMEENRSRAQVNLFSIYLLSIVYVVH